MKPKILAIHRQHSAVGYYRTWVPARFLRKKGYEVVWDESAPYGKSLGLSPEKRVEKVATQNFDLILADRERRFDNVGEIAGYRHWSPKSRLIIDFDDDFLQIPKWNRAYPEFTPGSEGRESGLAALLLAEMVTVSTQTLVDRFRDKTHNIRLAENCIDPVDWLDLPKNPCPRSSDDELWILYGGASGHYGDLDEVKEGILAVLRDPPVPLRLICFGALPAWMHGLSREIPGRLVSLPWAPFVDYPQAVAWGDFDIALAPLAEHPFNSAKSDIKALEAGIQRIPFLCSDVGPYASIPDECAMKLGNTPAKWEIGLRDLLKDAALRQSMREAAFKWVMDTRTVDRKGDQWENIVQEAAGLPRIECFEDTQLA